MPLATPMHGQKHGHALSLNRIRAPVGRASRTRYNVQAMARKSLFGSGPQEMSKYIKPGSTTLRFELKSRFCHKNMRLYQMPCVELMH